MQMFAATERFGPWSGEAWRTFIKFSGLHHVAEIVSTDDMLCSSLIDDLIDEDWQHNIHADGLAEFFHDFDYLKRRINYDISRHNLLALTKSPTSPPSAIAGFEFCGYDIIDSDGGLSVLTNCGGFPSVFAASEINRFGLLDDLVRANSIADKIRSMYPEDRHCRDCRVWSLSRFVGTADDTAERPAGSKLGAEQAGTRLRWLGALRGGLPPLPSDAGGSGDPQRQTGKGNEAGREGGDDAS